ncbi:MAG TPA: maleylpyruvate isomerase N-terminal domain-containing protein, partial [Dehalococcoidia bacterium]|nr:maleylpyruvate isomerase N-terminal domain-containing protein [Dehalococcoidia bacterium]
MRDLVNDLVAEQHVLDTIVAGLSADRWETPSPAEGWLLRDCVAHLAEFDDVAAAVIEQGSFTPGGGGQVNGLSRGQAEMRGWSTERLLD